MMGFDPMKIPFISSPRPRAGRRGFAADRCPREDISKVNYHFKTEKSLVVWGDQLFRKGAFSFLEPLVFHTPIFKLCILASALFHDNVWYP